MGMDQERSLENVKNGVLELLSTPLVKGNKDMVYGDLLQISTTDISIARQAQVLLLKVDERLDQIG
jgi:hypothetical protein